MTDPNRNARWARVIAEEMRRAGTGLAVLCPGSRNSPLLFALATAFGEDAVSHIDERSAGFLALGFMRASGRPAVVCVTSGSAVANLLPALVEARADRLPLLVISADRPWEAIGCGAPQALRQEGLLREGVLHEVFLGEPSDEDHALRSLRREVARLAQTAGPAHLNVPLRDPLPPLPDPTWTPVPVSELAEHGRADGTPFTHVAGPSTPPVPECRWRTPGQRVIIVVGPGPDVGALADLEALAHRTGFPVLADATARVRDFPGLITTGDALVGSALGQEPVDLLIVVGRPPVTRALQEWIAAGAGRVLTVSTVGGIDPGARAEVALEGPGALRALIAHVPALGDAVWRQRWIDADAAARARLTAAVAALPWGEAAAVADSLAASWPTFQVLASSMAIRHANLLRRPSPRPVFANRGTNGIDGTLGTFLGASRHAGAGLLVVGDLAFQHDLPALAAGGQGAIVLLNNGGGAIFDYLPVAQVPAYDRWVRTSHARTFGPAAELFGLIYHPVRDRAGLALALEQSHDGRLHLIECLVQGLEAVSEHRRLLRCARGQDQHHA